MEMVMSFAYVMSCVCLRVGSISKVYMLKSVGERTPPCGTPSFELALGGCSVSKCCVLFILLCS